ncbi:hypothetical protein J5N97_001668 [Dioscorea zingiberensis]|uniref:Uncharacterized protein n=1 Tax=Dioscorea zingiberensis TaxID=325984 RepID=A0A9D5BTI1_9LILI|nr:hypothetical protein J5N97_001668 [Dioscorea zingiberensis]
MGTSLWPRQRSGQGGGSGACSAVAPKAAGRRGVGRKGRLGRSRRGWSSLGQHRPCTTRNWCSVGSC